MDKLIDAVGAGYGPSVRIDAETTGLHHPVSLNCKIRADPELVLLCQKHGDKPHQGTPIGWMRELWPFASLKGHLLEQTKEFVRQMRGQGYDAAQPETAMLAYGPFREKADLANTALVNIEAGNEFFPDGRWVAANRGAMKAEKGPQELSRKAVLDSPDWQKGAVFIVKGRFLARRGRQEEETGTLLV